jgi:predicted RNA-binding protein
MKSLLVSIVAIVLLAGCGKTQDIDLNGKWLGKGYKCWGNLDEDGQELILDEEIFISQDGDKVVATKITGDECVKAGEKTWEGRISGDWIEGVAYGRSPNSSKPEAFKTRIEIKSINLLYLDSFGPDAVIEFVRIPEGQESKESDYDLNGKWLGRGYDCFDDNGNPVILDEWVSISQTNSIVTAIKLTGDNCIGEGQITWKGQIVRNEIKGVFYGTSPYQKNAKEYPVTLLIKNQNLILDKEDPSWRFERNLDN